MGCEDRHRKFAVKELLKQMGEVNKRTFSGDYGSPKTDWYEKTIFNEARLYTDLGKEDARTVLSVWRRYKETVKLLRAIELLED